MRVFAILALALAVAGPALAGQAVTLRADTADADGIVTLGDLFDGAGASASVPVAERQGTSVLLDAMAVQRIARRAGLDWPNSEGLRTIVVHAGLVGGGASAPGARGNVEVLTYARSLSAGEIVQPSDLVWAKAAAAPSDAPSDADAIIGQMAKRPVRAGSVVQARDVGAAQVIKKGDLVTVTYQAEGIALSLQGKAMGAAGVGEALSVENTVSKKVVQAMVTGPGQAVVGPEADQLKFNRSLRYAAR
ncbi:flagellar basal body P-ring formation chaperone FlgA [Phenylobacterium sp.]|uniref:flagellar basal body P-ring formation chaperone FlgA n=1 Tax=Phenylobacterium sp. TaxID=1871053 RepID=UPI00356493DF